MRGIYSPKTNLPVGSRKRHFCPSGRPAGRPANGHFYDRCATGRSPGRPGLEPESNDSLAGLPPGRLELDTESRTLCRSTGRSTGAISREQSSLDDRPPGRPAHQPKLACTSVHVSRLDRSTDFCLGRPSD